MAQVDGSGTPLLMVFSLHVPGKSLITALAKFVPFLTELSEFIVPPNVNRVRLPSSSAEMSQDVMMPEALVPIVKVSKKELLAVKIVEPTLEPSLKL